MSLIQKSSKLSCISCYPLLFFTPSDVQSLHSVMVVRLPEGIDNRQSRHHTRCTDSFPAYSKKIITNYQFKTGYLYCCYTSSSLCNTQRQSHEEETLRLWSSVRGSNRGVIWSKLMSVYSFRGGRVCACRAPNVCSQAVPLVLPQHHNANWINILGHQYDPICGVQCLSTKA